MIEIQNHQWMVKVVSGWKYDEDNLYNLKSISPQIPTHLIITTIINHNYHHYMVENQRTSLDLNINMNFTNMDINHASWYNTLRTKYCFCGTHAQNTWHKTEVHSTKHYSKEIHAEMLRGKGAHLQFTLRWFRGKKNLHMYTERMIQQTGQRIKNWWVWIWGEGYTEVLASSSPRWSRASVVSL